MPAITTELGSGVLPVALAAVSVVLLAACSDEPSASQGKSFGVVEGFYGDPYEFEERLAMVGFLSEVGLNTYLYAPKDDPFHRERWDEPYPSEYLEHFKSVQLLAEERGVRFIFGISPGGTYDPDAGQFRTLMEKLESVYARGIRHFCVLFDDVSGDSPGADPLVQSSVISAVWEHLRSLDGEATLCFVPSFYFGTAEQLENDDPPPQLFAYPHPPSAYYEAYEAIPREVSIMWTGRRVTPSTIETSEARAFRAFVARPVIIWDNALANDLLLARARGRARESPSCAKSCWRSRATTPC